VGKEEAESSTLYRPHSAEESPAPVRTLQVDNNASPTKAESCHTLPKYTEFSTETKSRCWFLCKSHRFVILHSFITHNIILLC